MRDRQAIYAAVKPSEVKAQWAFLAFLTLLFVPSTTIFFPDNRLLGGGLLAGSVAVGSLLAIAFPPLRRDTKTKPDVWATSGFGLLLVGSGLATRNGIFGLGCVSIGLVAYFVTFTVNTAKYHRRHGIVEPIVASPQVPTAEQMLHAVVDDVFVSEVAIEFTSPTEFKHRAHLTDQQSSRTAVLEAAGSWLELRLPDLGVSRLVEDEDAVDKQATLHDLALVARAYLRGEGWTDQALGLTGRRPVYVVKVGDRQWELGQSKSRVWHV